MLVDNGEGINNQPFGEGGVETGRQYSIAVFGQTGEEIGEWLRCTQLREQPGRVSFLDDHDHEVILRGGITVIQEQ